MSAVFPLGSRISGSRLAELLGPWRDGSGRQGTARLAAALRQLVLEGRLVAGTRLPSERELSATLAVSRTMVTSAVDRLREEGLLASRQGAGTWVTLEGAVREPGGWSAMSEPAPLDLALASPAAIPEFPAAVERAARRLPPFLAGGGHQLQGLLELREVIADRFTRRGLATGPEQILITNGAQHAFALVLRMLVAPGDRVLMEQPGYPNAYEAVRAVNGRIVVAALREDGWCLAEIEAAVRQSAPRLAYLMLDFHNPTGFRMAAPERDRLAGLLRRTKTMAVIDETLAELDFDFDPAAVPPPPMAAFAPEQVITIGSSSKLFWGGLRLGWIRTTPELVHRLGAARLGMDLGSPITEQLVLTELYTEAFADDSAVVARRLAGFARSRDLVLDLVGQHCPDWSVRRPTGGLSLWCDLGAPISARLAASARDRGVRIVSGDRFAVHGGLRDRLRLPYALPPEQLREAIRRLGMVAAGLSTRGGPEQEGPVLPVT
ncbi:MULTISPECIES: PLP-dependent aminotransferase family protein [Actinoalloteichus]|uniref:Transcriptional regulator with HTH domain and aminotransferase domain n=1 Tax=Actinoalloteichus fjordicus TaxID=1612552 RepID=A0AAC9LJ14_9PSEU|nr:MULTISPECIES: PLP-dependent aminotransferase family protein [Actinoalloteichus]APU17745.1 transcriptional regulator with HTH domain and aminotransferase domain [Actinoalloteichus fjordicus]APU23823.1 transcriptional regulator with HTH domain and aminotransferase domain [Actinoalloteichus sp. GBA129-24]